MSLAEYEAQLADVEELMKESPTDESLTTLKNDLQELIAITKEEQDEKAETETPPAPPANALEKALEAAVGKAVGSDKESEKLEKGNADEVESTKRKKRKLKDFELPAHLIPAPNDTEAELNRKRRAAKSLKSKWRAQKKEEESNKKQKSWQSFQKKKKIKKDSSMFATSDSKVGVVAAAGRQLSKSEERKRHKF